MQISQPFLLCVWQKRAYFSLAEILQQFLRKYQNQIPVKPCSLFYVLLCSSVFSQCRGLQIKLQCNSKEGCLIQGHIQLCLLHCILPRSMDTFIQQENTSHVHISSRMMMQIGTSLKEDIVSCHDLLLTIATWDIANVSQTLVIKMLILCQFKMALSQYAFQEG